jgi:thiosulfate/3-mercaptopyruvate sulfurtransferase
LLDGGFVEWHILWLPIESGANENSPRNFVGTPHPEMIVTTADVERLYAQPDWLLIDARVGERFRGEQETIDPVAGHIPNAVDRFHGANVGADGLFLPKDRLKEEFAQLSKGYKPDQIAVYCGSGVTSCHHLVAMAVAGLPQPKLYLGSWSEWIRDPSHPIALGK